MYEDASCRSLQERTSSSAAFEVLLDPESVKTMARIQPEDPANTTEIPLTGGFRNQVVRIGNTVRRPTPTNAEFVHELLDFLGRSNWAGAPRYLGQDSQDREVLSFIPGTAPWTVPFADYVLNDRNLYLAGRLVRQLHDLTAGTDLAGDQEVVLHNDLSPKNTIFQDNGNGPQPVAFIDWDGACAGPARRDIAQLCWQTLQPGPTVTDIPLTIHRMHTICDGYGIADRSTLIEDIINCQENLCTAIELGISEKNPDALILQAIGADAIAQADLTWTRRHGKELKKELALHQPNTSSWI